MTRLGNLNVLRLPVIYLSFLFSLFSSIILFYNLSISLSFCSICCLYLCCCTLLSIPLFFSIPLPLILSYHLSIYLTIYLSIVYVCEYLSIYLSVLNESKEYGLMQLNVLSLSSSIFMFVVLSVWL